MKRSPKSLSAIGLLGSVGFVLAICLVTSPTARAEDDYSRPGFYVGLSALGGFPLFDDPDLLIETKPSWGIGSRVGYRVSKYFAAEIQYEWLPDLEMESTFGQSYAYESHVVTANGRLMLPLEFELQLYLQGGLGFGAFSSRGNVQGEPFINPPVPSRYRLNGTQTTFAMRFGGGFEYYLTNHIVLNAEATAIYTKDQVLTQPIPVTTISGGIQYRF